MSYNYKTCCSKFDEREVQWVIRFRLLEVHSARFRTVSQEAPSEHFVKTEQWNQEELCPEKEICTKNFIEPKNCFRLLNCSNSSSDCSLCRLKDLKRSVDILEALSATSITTVSDSCCQFSSLHFSFVQSNLSSLSLMLTF